jgi:hypothetical protein
VGNCKGISQQGVSEVLTAEHNAWSRMFHGFGIYALCEQAVEKQPACGTGMCRHFSNTVYVFEK